MSRPVEVPATLTVFGAAPTRATLTLIPLSLGWRLAQVLGVLAACWGAAALSVFIPVAHFLLVPALAIGARSGPSSSSASTSGWSESAASVPDVDPFKTSLLGAPWPDSRLSTVPTAFNRLMVTIGDTGSASLAAQPVADGPPDGELPAQ